MWSTLNKYKAWAGAGDTAGLCVPCAVFVVLLSAAFLFTLQGIFRGVLHSAVITSLFSSNISQSQSYRFHLFTVQFVDFLFSDCLLGEAICHPYTGLWCRRLPSVAVSPVAFPAA